MLKYTLAAWHKITGDLKRMFFIFNVASLGFFIAYAIYSLSTRRGLVAVNITIALISAAYMVYSIVTYVRDDKADKKGKKWVTRIFKWSKISVNAVSLAYMVYMLYYLAGDVTLTSLVLTALSAISWILQVVLQLALQFVETRGELFIDGIEADFEKAINITRGVGNIIKRVKGEEIEEHEVLISAKNREILERQAAKDKQRKNEQREEKKAEKKAKKRAFRLRRSKTKVEPEREEEPLTK